MENEAITPTPANLEGLLWRPIDRADLATLTELARACFQADGGLSFLFEPEYLLERFFPDAPGASTGAFTPDGRLAACAAVHTGGDETLQRATILGWVRPDLRHRGLGGTLMRWSEAQALSLLANAPAEQGCCKSPPNRSRMRQTAFIAPTALRMCSRTSSWSMTFTPRCQRERCRKA